MFDTLPPYQFGGGMVFEAGFEKTTYVRPPQKYEAGTPPIAQVIGLGAALDYLQKNITFDAVQKHEAALCARMIDGLQKDTVILFISTALSLIHIAAVDNSTPVTGSSFWTKTCSLCIRLAIPSACKNHATIGILL